MKTVINLDLTAQPAAGFARADVKSNMSFSWSVTGRHRKVKGLRPKLARRFPSRSLQARDLTPPLQGYGSQFTVMVGRDIVAWNMEEIGDRVMDGDETLEMSS